MTLVFAVAAASAQTIGTAAAGTGSITITNAALNETYKVFRLFDATLTNVPSTGDSTGIAYSSERNRCHESHRQNQSDKNLLSSTTCNIPTFCHFSLSMALLYVTQLSVMVDKLSYMFGR